jgi:hypothetical protein
MDVVHGEETSGAMLGVEDEALGNERSYQVKTIGSEDAAPDESDATEMVLALDIDAKECQCFLVIK